MANFHQLLTIFFMEFINIGPAHIRGWVRGAQGGWVVAKAKTKNRRTQIEEFRVAMISTCTHKRANVQGLDTDSGSHIRSSLPNWSPPLAPFHQLWIDMVGKKHCGRTDQLTLASGGSEHA